MELTLQHLKESAVGVGTSGYFLIDKEIIAYNAISGNTITIELTEVLIQV